MTVMQFGPAKGITRCLINAAAKLFGGGGGGKPELAQGWPNAERLEGALAAGRGGD